MLWDAGTYELLGDKPVDQQMEIGDLKFRLHGSKLGGDFALVRMKARAKGKGNEWLLIKKKDEAARPGWNLEAHAVSVATGRTQEEIALDFPAKSPGGGTGGLARSVPGAVAGPMPDSMVPMQAFATATPPTGSDWIHEVKWDGVRAICYIDSAGVRLVSRNGNRCELQYPELGAIRSFVNAERAVLDGEIAVSDERGRPRFQLIQHRIHVTGAHTIANLAKTLPAQYFVFDLLYLDGYDLRKSPLAERKHLLQSILTQGPVVRLSEHFEGDPQVFLEAARQNQLEGIVSKRASSAYESRRSPNWLKTKIVSQQEFVICGFTKGERGGYFGALVVGLYEDGELVWAGNVGTGFDTRTLESVSALLAPLVTSKRPFREQPAGVKDITWVRPELVCAVKFANWTGDSR
jgi:bifunctional non-homologous end joining protein LigD